MTGTRPIESVAIVLYEGFDELGAIGPYEVLENAPKPGPISTLHSTRSNLPAE